MSKRRANRRVVLTDADRLAHVHPRRLREALREDREPSFRELAKRLGVSGAIQAPEIFQEHSENIPEGPR